MKQRYEKRYFVGFFHQSKDLMIYLIISILTDFKIFCLLHDSYGIFSFNNRQLYSTLISKGRQNVTQILIIDAF